MGLVGLRSMWLIMVAVWLVMFVFLLVFADVASAGGGNGELGGLDVDGSGVSCECAGVFGVGEEGAE